MNPEKQCPKCGAAIPAETPEALCPACLLRRGFETQTAGGALASDVPLPTPESLASRFPQLEIVELLGRGGMGAVYKARHRNLDRWVALKILPAAAQRDPAFAERFSREAKALARLDHPNIVAVHDSGEADGLYYFIMDYVDGATLRQILASGGIAPEQALAIVPQICEALQYAHDQGIVHRDIKPENILVDKAGRVKIADFGIAKIVGHEASDFTLTAMGEVMGTPAYMAPEQVEHPSAVDHRADIYSLGVVFYQMLTGELPLGRFAPPSRKVHIDVRLDEVVLRTLEKEPDLRYQHAGEVKTEVETIAGTPGSQTNRIQAAPVQAADGWGWNALVDYRSKTTLWGLPLIHIAQGIDPATGRPRVARGIIAIGGIAQGVIAIGGCAVGGIACGGLAIGGIAFGGLGIGVLVLAGVALGIAGAWGGFAMALIALGGAAIGYYAKGGWAAGMHIWDATTKDPAAFRFFQGSWPQNLADYLQVASLVMGFLIFAVSSGAIIWARNRTAPRNRGDSLNRWIQLAIILVILTAFGINAALSWNAIQQHRKKEPASALQIDLAQKVREAVEIISQCSEGDPRVMEALQSLKGLDPARVSSALVPFLDSSVPTTRRAAIYILYVGGLKTIAPAVAALEKLLTNPEDLTRGMAALALGTHKEANSFDALIAMAKNDSSGFARRCAVYALGLLGDKRAIPTLKSAQNDSDSSVRQNANAALDLVNRTPGDSIKQNQQNATGFVDLLAKGDFAQARAGFDQTMRGAMSEEALATLWKQLEANGGKFLGHDAPRQEAFGGYQIVYVPCRWERVRLDLKVVYNTAGQISGLWIVSPGASMFGNPPSGNNQPAQK